MTRTLSFLLKIQPPTYGKLITILSNIDGGGARRIIPKTILDQLEKELQVLDVIAGRSSDGQMTVMLTAPNEQNRLHLFAAKDINKFYLHNCPGIFPQRRGIFKSLMVIPTFDIKKLHPTIFSRHQCSHSNTLNKIQSSERTEEAQQLSDGTTVTDSTTNPSEKTIKLIHGLPLTGEAQQLSDGTPSTSKNQKQAVIDSTLTPSKENTNPINGLPPSTEAQHLSDVTPDTTKNPNSAATTPSKENTNPIDGLPPITKTQQLSEETSPPDTSNKNPNSATTPSKENSTNPIDGLLPTTKAQQSSDQTLNTNKDPKPVVPDSSTIPATPLFPSTLTLPDNFQMSINIGTTITVNYYGK